MSKLFEILNEFSHGSTASGELLRAFRKRDGFSLKMMEEITGIAQSNLSAIENGKIDMTLHYAEIFAAALKIHPAVLLYPNGIFSKNKKLLEIEKKANKLRKYA